MHKNSQDAWDGRYNSAEYIFGTEPNDFLRSVASHIKGKKVLCLAEGEGQNAVFLARQGSEVTAVDFSVMGKKKAEKLAKTNHVNLKYIISDLESYQIVEEVWDAIILIHLHLPCEPLHKLWQRAVAGLRPGGNLILESYSVNQLKYDSGGPRELDILVELSDALTQFASLRLDIAQETVRDIHEGIRHTGTSAVVQILGTKDVR